MIQIECSHRFTCSWPCDQSDSLNLTTSIVLVKYLLYCSVNRLTCSLTTEWLTVWLTGWLIDWLETMYCWLDHLYHHVVDYFHSINSCLLWSGCLSHFIFSSHSNQNVFWTHILKPNHTNKSISMFRWSVPV